jgi:Uma2 family endonuclease
MPIASTSLHEIQSSALLYNVSWQTYECLTKDYADRSSPRLTYDRGTLEIMSPLILHEETNRTVARIVETVLEEWGIDYNNYGSTTFRREDAAKGVEPDTCFYIQNVGRLKGKRQADLSAGDPPPDLVIEIDDTNPSLAKLPIFAAFGVPEVWRISGDTVVIHRLVAAVYEMTPRSVALTNLSGSVLSGFLARSRMATRLEWINAVRGWAQENEPSLDAE